MTAPDGKVFKYDPTDVDACKNLYWTETSDEFWFAAKATDFEGGTIPSGKYIVKIKDTTGQVLTASESIKATFSLPCPVLTDPAAGATVAGLTPKIKWKAVEGAQLYRIFLRNKDWNEQIYPCSTRNLLVYRNWVTIPKGVLMPQTNYEIRIEARNSDQDYDQRARSDWVAFRTP